MWVWAAVIRVGRYGLMWWGVGVWGWVCVCFFVTILFNIGRV